MTNPHSAPGRLASLDQYRGYTVAGMFLVNFVGSYTVIKSTWPTLVHHHTYCSYADTIMPQFLFAAGFAMRLTFLNRVATQGWRTATFHAARRCLALLLVAFVVHHLDGRYDSWDKVSELGMVGFFRTAFQRSYFQTLTHIALTSLWVLPVLATRVWVRLVFAVFSAVLFHLLSQNFYYHWVMTRPGIDGGPLGFLTWTIPFIAGTLAHDAMNSRTFFRRIGLLSLGALLLMILGYALSIIGPLQAMAPGETDWWHHLAAPPFVPPWHSPDIWTMSQRAGSVSYLSFGAGFSLAVFAVFVLVADLYRIEWSLFRTLGTNALVGYILHDLVNAAVRPFVPRDSPLWYVLIGFAVSFIICYLMLDFLHRKRLFLKL